MSVQTLSAPVSHKSTPAPVPLTADDLRVVDRLTGWNITIAMAALSIGVLLGILQGLEHATVDLYPYIAPLVHSYYQGLTMHGVLNALVWTTFFIVGFFTYALPRSLDRPLRYPWVNRLALVIMIVGLVMAAIPMLLDYATVLYTFYPPMQAHWAFYLGLTLVVVGSWTVGYGFYFTYGAWRKENPGQTTPVIALMILITMVLWQLCTLGVAAEILTLLLPWSLGLVEGTDPLMARTLFWFFGHPLVYFWLLPAYVSWYAMLPAQTDGKMFSENLSRLVFWLFLLFSTPVGFHHQFTDPGIPIGWKFFHSVVTYGVAFPSLITAFTVVASLEVGARVRGGRGYLRWIRRLNWGDPSYAAQNLAMILFVFGGIGGIANASYNVNMTVHNTTWVPGHFHLTVGSAVTLTFFGISYWLVPALTGHRLFRPALARMQAWTWFFGMILFSNAFHALGLYEGAPRRSMLGAAPYREAAWTPYLAESVLGIALLTVSAFCFFTVMLGTVLSRRKPEQPVEMPVAGPLVEHTTPGWLDSWTPWLVGAVALILLAYGPMLYNLIVNLSLWSPGYTVW